MTSSLPVPLAVPVQLAEGHGCLYVFSSTLSLQKPTTGLLAITMALHFCDLVHIAGFGYPDSANKKQTIHYYEQITLKSMAVSIHPHFFVHFTPIFPLGWGGTQPRRLSLQAALRSPSTMAVEVHLGMATVQLLAVAPCLCSHGGELDLLYV